MITRSANPSCNSINMPAASQNWLDFHSSLKIMPSLTNLGRKPCGQWRDLYSVIQHRPAGYLWHCTKFHKRRGSCTMLCMCWRCRCKDDLEVVKPLASTLVMCTSRSLWSPLRWHGKTDLFVLCQTAAAAILVGSPPNQGMEKRSSEDQASHFICHMDSHVRRHERLLLCAAGRQIDKGCEESRMSPKGVKALRKGEVRVRHHTRPQSTLAC